MGKPFYEPNVEVLAKPHWKRPDNKNKGDPNDDVVYKAVGVALTNWEKLEETLAVLFLSVTEQTNSSTNPVKRAFGAVESSGTRRKMLLAAADAYFGVDWDDKEIRLSFFRVIEAVGFASQRRDDIAHGKVYHFNKEPNFGAFLLPANYNTDRTKAWTYSSESETDPLFFTFTQFRYTSDDINEFAKRFEQLSNSIGYLTGFIRKLDDGTILFSRAVKGMPFLET